MATNRTVRTIVVSMVVALLALSFLAFTASARVTHGGSVAASAACSAAMPSSSIERTAASNQLAFHPDKLYVQKSAIGAAVCIKNATAQPEAVGYHNGQAIGVLLPSQASVFSVKELEANGTTVLSLMPQSATGPILIISFNGPSGSSGAACSATLSSASLTKTAIGQWAFQPARLSVQKSALGGAVCIRNSSAQSVAVGYHNGQAIGSLGPNESKVFFVKEEEANGITQLSLMPQSATGPTLTLVFE